MDLDIHGLNVPKVLGLEEHQLQGDGEMLDMPDMPVLGVIENMSGLTCPPCHGTIDLFGSGGASGLHKNIRFHSLERYLPLYIQMREAGDAGHPFIGKKQDSPTWKTIDEVMDRLMDSIEKK